MAGPTLVGTNKIASSAAGTSVSVTLPASVAAGNMIVVAAATDDTTVPATTALNTSTPTMTWTRILTRAGGGAQGSLALFVAVGVPGGATVINFVNGTAFVAVSAAEFTNGQSAADGTANNAGATAIPNAGAITSTNANDTFFAAATDSLDTVTWVAGTSYTLLSTVASNVNTTIGLQFQSVSAVQTSFATAFGTCTGMTSWSAIAAAIKLQSTLSCSPTTLATGVVGTTVTLTGTGTAWTSGFPGTPTFGFSKSPTNDSSASSQHVVSATSAQLTVSSGATNGIITITDPGTGATCTITVGTGGGSLTPFPQATPFQPRRDPPRHVTRGMLDDTVDALIRGPFVPPPIPDVGGYQPSRRPPLYLSRGLLDDGADALVRGARVVALTPLPDTSEWQPSRLSLTNLFRTHIGSVSNLVPLGSPAAATPLPDVPEPQPSRLLLPAMHRGTLGTVQAPLPLGSPPALTPLPDVGEYQPSRQPVPPLYRSTLGSVQAPSPLGSPALTPLPDVENIPPDRARLYTRRDYLDRISRTFVFTAPAAAPPLPEVPKYQPSRLLSQARGTSVQGSGSAVEPFTPALPTTPTLLASTGYSALGGQTSWSALSVDPTIADGNTATGITNDPTVQTVTAGIDLGATYSVASLTVTFGYKKFDSETLEYATNSGGPWTLIPTPSFPSHGGTFSLETFSVTGPFVARYFRFTANETGGFFTAGTISIREISAYYIAPPVPALPSVPQYQPSRLLPLHNRRDWLARYAGGDASFALLPPNPPSGDHVLLRTADYELLGPAFLVAGSPAAFSLVTLSARGVGQTITIASPTGGIFVGNSVALPALGAAGVPFTFAPTAPDHARLTLSNPARVLPDPSAITLPVSGTSPCGSSPCIDDIIVSSGAFTFSYTAPIAGYSNGYCHNVSGPTSLLVIKTYDSPVYLPGSVTHSFSFTWPSVPIASLVIRAHHSVGSGYTTCTKYGVVPAYSGNTPADIYLSMADFSAGAPRPGDTITLSVTVNSFTEPTYTLYVGGTPYAFSPPRPDRPPVLESGDGSFSTIGGVLLPAAPRTAGSTVNQSTDFLSSLLPATSDSAYFNFSDTWDCISLTFHPACPPDPTTRVQIGTGDTVTLCGTQKRSVEQPYSLLPPEVQKMAIGEKWAVYDQTPGPTYGVLMSESLVPANVSDIHLDACGNMVITIPCDLGADPAGTLLYSNQAAYYFLSLNYNSFTGGYSYDYVRCQPFDIIVDVLCTDAPGQPFGPGSTHPPVDRRAADWKNGTCVYAWVNPSTGALKVSINRSLQADSGGWSTPQTLAASGETVVSVIGMQNGWWYVFGRTKGWSSVDQGVTWQQNLPFGFPHMGNGLSTQGMTLRASSTGGLTGYRCTDNRGDTAGAWDTITFTGGGTPTDFGADILFDGREFFVLYNQGLPSSTRFTTITGHKGTYAATLPSPTTFGTYKLVGSVGVAGSLVALLWDSTGNASRSAWSGDGGGHWQALTSDIFTSAIPVLTIPPALVSVDGNVAVAIWNVSDVPAHKVSPTTGRSWP